jgi:hypothetical protein
VFYFNDVTFEQSEDEMRKINETVRREKREAMIRAAEEKKASIVVFKNRKI